MKICWCTIHVNNLEKSKYFYQEVLGLSETRSFKPAPDMTIAFFSDQHGMEIELIHTQNQTPISQGSRVSICIVIDHFDELLRKLEEQGYVIKRGPLTLGEDTHCFFIDDPNGVEIQVIKG